MIGKRRDPQQGTGGGASCLRGHGQFQLRACTLVFVRIRQILAVANREGGTCDGVDCVDDGFAH